MDSYASGKPSTPESLLSRRKQAIIARSMAQIERQLDQWLENDALQPKPAKRPAKRARDDDDDESEMSASNKNRKSQSSSAQKRTKRGDGDSVRYACPFAKHDPVRFRNVKTCCGPGWSDLHRVKEHIYRRHSLKNACNRCFEFFGDAKGLKEHQRSKTPCRLRDKIPTDVITDEQEEQLRARAKANSPPVDKWQDMYRIIFPGAKAPSPYYDTSDDELLSKASSQSRFKDFDECKAYVRREVLRQVKPVLVAEVEKAFQAVETRVIRKANELVRDVQSKIFRTWQFQSDQAVREREREPTPAPELADIGTIITDGLGDDPMFSFLVPEGGLNWDAFMAPAGMGAEHEGDCEGGEGSVGDSAYFTSSGLEDAGSWGGGSYSS